MPVPPRPIPDTNNRIRSLVSVKPSIQDKALGSLVSHIVMQVSVSHSGQRQPSVGKPSSSRDEEELLRTDTGDEEELLRTDTGDEELLRTDTGGHGGRRTNTIHLMFLITHLRCPHVFSLYVYDSLLIY